MKAGIYTRVSTDLQVQHGESLDEQFHGAEAYCKFKNIPIIDTYREEGRSGKNIDRPELRRLLRDCRSGKIDTVIVKKLDRLSRSILDFEKMLRYFEEYNIALVSLKENFDTGSPMSRAAVRIILVFAQLEREQTSERTKDAMKYRAERGIWNCGHRPLGYNLNSKRELVINQEEAVLVKLIFEKYIELASYIKVAQYLNNMGYRTKRDKTKDGKETGGSKFINSNIAKIIQNPVYLGKMPYKNQVFSASHEPIISEELHNQAQEIRKENDRRNGNLKGDTKHNFLLEGLLQCGECNSQMTPRYSTGRSKLYYYYACTKPIHRGNCTCSVRTMSAPAIEQLVLQRIRTLAKDNELLQQVMNSNYQATHERIKELRSQEKELEENIARIDKKIISLSDAFIDTIAKDKEHAISIHIHKLDQERKELAQKRIETNIEANELEKQTICKEAAKESLIGFTDRYHSLSPYDKKYLISQLIHSIIYTKDKIIARYYILPDIDTLPISINKKGAATNRLPLAAGCATPTSWRHSLHSTTKLRRWFQRNNFSKRKGWNTI